MFIEHRSLCHNSDCISVLLKLPITLNFIAQYLIMAKEIPELDAEMPSVEEDLYKLLGIESDATLEAIKTAYKKSALRNHPGMQLYLHCSHDMLTQCR